MKTKSIRYLLIIFFGICLIANVYLHFLLEPLVGHQGRVFEVSPGESKSRVFAALQEQGIVRHPWLFAIYIYPHKNTQIKAGEYFFPKGSTTVSIWQQIINGTGFYLRSFTIIPGWTFQDLRLALLSETALRHETKSLSDQQIMQYLGAPNFNPEGEFFPETYCYTKGISDLIILKRAYHDMQLALTQNWSKRAPGLPYKTEYEALIAASLIEKEAYLESERPLIAGVLVNRLKKEMLLQFDPTVIYGLGALYQGKLYKSDLVKESIYNTYLHKGLPPTPIAMPSLSSLQAALHPKEHEYYYFVAKGDGSHQFSKTLMEHHHAIKTIVHTEKK
jgi:UPF0755 protein